MCEMRHPILLCLLLLVPATAPRAEIFPDTSHLAFATLNGSNRIEVIDIDSDKIAGHVELDMIPSQIVVSQSSPILAAADGRSDRIVLADLATGRTVSTSLAFPARRLLASADGQKLAVSDLDGGHVAVYGLPGGRLLAAIADLPPLSDLIFNGDGTSLLVAGKGLRGLGVVDIAQARMTRTIPASTDPAQPSIGRLARSANGRLIFALAASSDIVGVIDLRGAKPLAPIRSGMGTVSATPSGSGAYVLLANETKPSFAIFHGDDLSRGAELPAATGLGATYTGWFDSVAFVPSADRHALLVYDLWHLSEDDDIPLPAASAPGTVTADGTKLFLPLPDKHAVAVVDARNRRLTRLIALDGTPNGVTVGAGYGICH